MKIDNNCLRTSGNSIFKEKVTEFLNFLSESEENKQLPSEQILNLFEKHIVQSAKDVTKSETKHHPDCFSQSEKSLLLHIELRNEAFKRQTKNSHRHKQSTPKGWKKSSAKRKKESKRKWQFNLSSKCQCKDLKQTLAMPGRCSSN